MNRVLGGMLVLVLGLSAVAAQDEGQDKSATPAQQYQQLLEQFQRAASPGRVLSDEERLKFVGQAYKLRYELALKFVALAEKYPRDPIAVDALSQAVWQVNTRPWPVELVGKDDARTRAFELLQRDHIRSEKLGPACRRLSFGFCEEYETFLRAVLEKNPHQDVRAEACLALAHFLSHRLQRLDLLKEQPELAQEFEGLFGKEYVEELRWNLAGTPTLYVIDHQGVIRHKWVGSPGEKTIDEALEKLIIKAQSNGENTGEIR